MQNWIDGPAKESGLKVILSGSSQRMMQGLVLEATAPRYWELAHRFGADVVKAVDALVLDPLGPLHHEPDRRPVHPNVDPRGSTASIAAGDGNQGGSPRALGSVPAVA
ncbi:MAG: hypothetical protein EA382_17430 [Spirochaetaceae bacterium]|nr:MAG: hypothetical protein EA382_17430 [Spirochaetaceae bacterium]